MFIPYWKTIKDGVSGSPHRSIKELRSFRDKVAVALTLPSDQSQLIGQSREAKPTWPPG
jgi:hypothetical protein